MDAISILAALDEHYLPQLHVLLTSLRLNNPGEHMDLYLLQSAVSPEGLAGVERLCAAFGYGFFPVRVDDALFQGAPVSRQYPKEMYSPVGDRSGGQPLCGGRPHGKDRAGQQRQPDAPQQRQRLLQLRRTADGPGRRPPGDRPGGDLPLCSRS